MTGGKAVKNPNFKSDKFKEFFNRYNINPNYRDKRPKKTWSPLKKSQNTGFLSGYGYITLYRTGNSVVDLVQIHGKFNKGKLVSKPRVLVYGSNCIKRGYLFCKIEAKDVYKKYTTTANLNYTIKKGIDKVIKNIEIKSKKARRNMANSSSSSSSSSSNNSIKVCIPYTPKYLSHSKCRAKTASGSYENATVDLFRDTRGSRGCFTLSIYGRNGYGGGNTCSGLSDGWAVSANGSTGYASNLPDAIAWLLKRI